MVCLLDTVIFASEICFSEQFGFCKPEVKIVAALSKFGLRSAHKKTVYRKHVLILLVPGYLAVV